MQKSFLGAVILAAASGYGMSASRAATSLVFTLDLSAPCSGSACTGTNPTDLGLQLQAGSFNYTVGTGSQAGSYLAQIGVQTPLVCDEIQSTGTLGPATTSRLEPDFTNASPGGLLEFNAGGASIVDVAAFVYDGTAPAGVAASYSNFSAPQVICYQVNSVAGGTPVFAAGPGGIFSNGFENHVAGEPWISVQTVYSPNATAPAAPALASPTPANTMAYVVQIHNASNAANWRLSLGYDGTFFTGASQWGCVLGSNNPQPGPISGTCGSTISLPYTLKAADVQSATNSIYIYVSNTGTSTASTNWSTLSSAFYPAVAAVFPPFGTYPRRMDDKSAVATANNVPVQNIGGIVCNNDVTSTQCTLYDADGNAGNPNLPVHFTNSISSTGAVTADPLVYFADPKSGSTGPGNVAADALTASNVSCNDPNVILASTPSFTTVPSAKLGGLALSFKFKPSGSPNFPYVAGTANCTATFSAAGFAPSLTTTQSFSITMNPAAVGSVALIAQSGQTASPGGTVAFTLNVSNSGNAALSNVLVSNPLPTNVQSLSWTCTSAGGAACPAASGSGAISQTVSTLPIGGSLSYVITATLQVVAAFVPASQVTDAASITVPGGSCAGGNCSANASVSTVPIMAVTLDESPTSYASSNTLVTYTLTLTNQGGTDASGLALSDPSVAGLTFGSWICTPTGATSSCPHVSGSGAINEAGIAVSTGGSVVYSLQATTLSTGNVTNMATLTTSGAAVCSSGACSASKLLSYTGP